ncbi:hypothetical protein INT45_013269 [Circinella minor]|uniref:Uncharacterized protein n=1 Tax=Circinella minor TaxID=1195481 RepID=A0A8H7VMI0_9FUNG|nr:hypothetical protein INT45_013269 [Circinella minor]
MESSSIDHTNGDEEVEEMEQDIESSYPSIHELLSLLVEKTNNIEATLSGVLTTQSQHNEILKAITQTLGVNVEIPIITGYNSNSIIHKKRTTIQNRTRALLVAPTTRTPLSPTRTPTPPIQNESLTNTHESSMTTSNHSRQSQQLPSKFVLAPKMRRKGNVVQAIHSLARSSVEGRKMMTFLHASANRAVRRVFEKAESSRPDLGGSWSHQDEEVRQEAVEWLVQTVTNFHPSIPLAKCEDDWIIKYLFPRKYNDFVYTERKRIKKKGIRRVF